MKRTGGVRWGGFAVIMLCLPVLAGAASLPAPATGNLATESEGPYVVRKGDTLWGISKDLLQDPLLWPRLWEKNPAIKDPNLIYPGDRLTLPGKEIAPAIASPKDEPAKEKAEAAPPPAVPQEAPRPAAPPAPIVAKPDEPPLPTLSSDAVVCSPALTTEAAIERVGIGSIVKSVDDRVMISMEDRVVVGLDGNTALNPGDRLVVVRPAQRLIHPKTGQPISRVLYVLGLLEITGVRDRVVEARVSYSCASSSVGDRVAPYTPVSLPVGKSLQPTQRAVEGVILDTVRGEQLIGMLQVVFFDVGTAQGVGSGDVFAIYRLSGPVADAAGVTFTAPPERLGEALIIRVTDQTATAVVTVSAREIRVGDRAVLSRQIAP